MRKVRSGLSILGFRSCEDVHPLITFHESWISDFNGNDCHKKEILCRVRFSMGLVYLNGGKSNHYVNMPMHYVAMFKGCKNERFFDEKLKFLLIFALKHRSWVLVRTASNEYPRSMF